MVMAAGLPAILAGDVPLVLLVGVNNAADHARPWPDRRGQGYLPGRNRRRFNAHLLFRHRRGHPLGGQPGRRGWRALGCRWFRQRRRLGDRRRAAPPGCV
jgi:hypothetical protein